MQMVLVGVGCAVVLTQLACGGLFGPNVSDRAVEMCELLSEEHDGVECQLANVGDTVELDGVRITVDLVKQVEGLDSLPAIGNMDERAHMREVGRNMVVMHMTSENTTPVQWDEQRFTYPFTNNAGQSTYREPYNIRVYTEATPEVEPKPRYYDFVRGEPVTFAGAFGGAPQRAVDSTLAVWTEEERIDPDDPRGRRRDFYTSLVVDDLGFRAEDE